MKKTLLLIVLGLFVTSVMLNASENIIPMWFGPITHCENCGENAVGGTLREKKKTGHEYRSCIHGYNGDDLIIFFTSKYDMRCQRCNYSYVDVVTSSSVKCKARNK